MQLKIIKTDGSDSGKKATLSDDIFKVEPNEVLVYEDIRSYLSNQRQGTAKTKERAEVRGGGSKAYRQKGTGNARRGTMRSPLLKGGGTVFGPRPRTYTVKLNKKMHQLARKSALSYKASDKTILIIEDFSFDEPKTKKMIEIINALKLDNKKVLLLTPDNNQILYKSAGNLKKVRVLEAGKPSTYEIMNADYLVLQKSAIKVLENNLKPKVEKAEA
ncbi:MAG: 50S ribosomal protein L4 [Flavobacteriaceae bacterium]